MAAFGITTTLAFIFSIYEDKAHTTTFFSRKKFLSKLVWPR
jgi:hypothetical protein